MSTTLESCPFYIGGEWLTPKVAGTPVFNPSTGDVIAECPIGTVADVNAAVEAAHAAFPAWMETPPVERARILGRFKMLMEDNFEDIVRSNTREHGKTLVESRGDVKRGMEVVEFALGVPSLTASLHTPAAGHERALSVIVAIVLLVCFALLLVSTLVQERASRGEARPPHEGGWPLALALGVLAVTGVLAALVSDWFVAALEPSMETLGISDAFAGLVIVAIAGNAVENVVAVSLAWKGNNDLAISVVKNSVSQIACFLFPVLVLASLAFAHRLTFVVDPVYLGALALTAIALWQITGDGRAVLFEGLALVSLYVVLATLVWFE